MTDTEVHVDVQHTSDQQTLVAQQEDKFWGTESDCTDNLQYTPQGEDSLSLLADVALLPPRDGDVPCSYDSEAGSCEVVRPLERSLQPMQLQLQFLLSHADSLLNRLISRSVNQSSTALAEEVQRFLYTCQPYFNHVESTTRSAKSLCTYLSFDIYCKLLDFSQQLCDRLEQLVLTLSNYNLVSLHEAKPDSISHFCIGQSHLYQLRVTAFRYCKLTPYLSQVNTGIYKRMRWNVERLRDNVQQLQKNTGEEDYEEREEETVGDTEYYFLCCEEIPQLHSNAVRESHGASVGVVKMWSIGLWVQVIPDTEDIFGWIMCKVPQASYHRLLSLGSDEPLCFTATDHLYKLLRSHLDTRATQSTQQETDDFP